MIRDFSTGRLDYPKPLSVYLYGLFITNYLLTEATELLKVRLKNVHVYNFMIYLGRYSICIHCYNNTNRKSFTFRVFILTLQQP